MSMSRPRKLYCPPVAIRSRNSSATFDNVRVSAVFASCTWDLMVSRT